MSYQQSQPPRMGATFIPGGFDDYYMPQPPDVISPAPQRIMPEVPENMQDNLARLELDANQSPRNTHAMPLQSPPPNAYGQQATSPGFAQQPYQQQQQQPPPPPPVPAHGQEPNFPQQPPPPAHHAHNRSADYTRLADVPSDGPNFSPFPKIPNRPSHVPPSDDEKESILEGARTMVLNSNDPEMQLAWAQDALSYVDAAMCHEQRLSETQPARSVTPAVEHQLRVDAMNVVSFLADQHHPRAMFIRGMWLEFGKFGLRVDKKEAFRSYTRAAEKGYARAEYRMGMQYESTNDPATALVHYKRGAEQGDSASLYRLGMMTLLGQHGQPQDFAKGLQLIRQAAASADENAPQGAYVLGMLQARELPQINVPEIFLPYDDKEARQNIERAAYLGFAKAQLKMGAAYELCTLGCEFNPALSLHYNALAARQGEAEAEMAISKWFLCGYEGVFQKNEELAYTYAMRAAQQALPTAEFAMGYFNEIGIHVPVNIEKALEWYEKASKSGNKDAQARIDSISKSTTLSKKDHENIAISRIKSQYGSKRGARPDRFKNQGAPPVPSMPNIIESSPSDYSQNSAITPSSQGPPSRASTTTPYPMSDQPPIVAPLERPATVAPYPLENGPPSAGRPGPAGGFFAPGAGGPPPMQRPTSAFQINPNIYPGNGAPPPGVRPLGPPGNAPQRPYSTTAEGFPPRRDSRIPSGGAPNPNYGAPGGYRPSTTGPPVQRQDNYPPASKPQLPPLDIGYTAPLEVKKNPRPAQGARPPAASLGYEAPLDPKPNRVGTGGLSTSPGRPPAQGMQPGRPGSRPNSRPGSAGRTGTPAAGTPHPPGSYPPKAGTPKPQGAPGSAPGAKPAAPAQQKPLPKPAAPAAAKPPGKGPKTFDEMGIAQTKDSSDCVIM